MPPLCNIIKSKMENSHLKKTYSVLFIIVFILICLLYRYDRILPLRPQSIHQWRQTDCLSLSYNYYQNGMHFLKPEIHNQLADAGHSGYSAGEFPGLYYLVAFVWKIFGYKEMYYRILCLLISFAGLFALYKTLTGLLKSSFWGVLLSLFLFTSPIVAYYSNNFLTNMPAMSFSLIGWYFFYRFYLSGKTALFYASTAFFLLAALLKIPESIHYILIICIYLIDSLTNLKLGGTKKIFSSPFSQLIPFILFFICLIAWYCYAAYYNNLHRGKYTFNDIWPIWRMSAEQIMNVKEFTKKIMIYQTFHKTALYMTLLCCLFICFFIKRVNKVYLGLMILFMLGSCAYLILWFNALDAHDYYITNILIWPSFIYLTCFDALKNRFPRFFDSPFLKIAFLLLFATNVLYCAKNIKMRYWLGNNEEQLFATDYEKGYWWWMNTYYKQYTQALETIEIYNRLAGIKPTDKVVCIPDGSINISLYLMNQKGWTDYGDSDLKDEARLQNRVSLGAKYLFLIDPEFQKKDFLKPFLAKKVGVYQNISIYSLNVHNPELK